MPESQNILVAYAENEDDAYNMANDIVKADITDLVEVSKVRLYRGRYLSGDRTVEIKDCYKVSVRCSTIRNLRSYGFEKYMEIVYHKYRADYHID